MPELRRAMTLILLALAALLAGPAHVRGDQVADAPKAGSPKTGATWSGPFFFIQMSDSHIGWRWEPGATGFDEAISAANRLKPAFVVVTGDLIDAAGNRVMFARFKAIAKKLDPSIPLYLVPGNHDLGDVPTPQTLAIFHQVIGPDHYSFDVRGCHFIVFDSEIINRPEKSGDEMPKQLAWLKADLEKAAARRPVHIMTFSHHPVFEARFDEPDAHGNLPLARRGTYLGLLEKYKVTASLAGHQHYNARAWYGGTEMITTGSLCKSFPPLCSGFCVVKVFEDHIEHNFYLLGYPPDRVILEDGRPATRPGATAPGKAGR